MPIDEIFPHPLVKQVIFQVRFPNLFFLESRIGEFQVGVMAEFPESALVLQRHFVIAHGDPKSLSDAMEGSTKDSIDKVWQFSSPDGVELNLTSTSLSITSERHKTYNLGENDRFRDTIESVCNKFLDVAKIPLFTRVGLRYLNDCPIPDKTTVKFEEFYNSALPLARFKLESAVEMNSLAVVEEDTHGLRYREVFASGEKNSYRLDIDAWSEKVDAAEVMPTTDRLHEVISNTFESSIKQPVLEIMRGKHSVSQQND